MCGIAGIIDFDRPVAAEEVIRLRDRLVHRGPDDAGHWLDATSQPAVGFGHRRLAILDRTSAGRQPMLTPDGQIAIVFNGEIYNFVELAAQLSARGFHFQTRTDTEVILAAYEAWGEECVTRFNGMWSLAIWDRRRRRLFASRDRFGKKPFYYHWNGRRFVFASEMKSLAADPEIGCRADAEMLARFCTTLRAESSARTMFAGIEQLPAAHRLVLDDRGQLRIDRYWSLDPEARIDLPATDDYVERFRELFDDAVRIRLRSDVPVGSSLSGGLDSSLIVGTMAKLRGGPSDRSPQRTFSARFPRTPLYDEGPFIDAVVARTHVDAHRTEPTADGLLSDLRALHYHQEEPILSSSIYAQWEVMRLARRRQTIVLLDGQGSDEILAGYLPYFASHLVDLVARRSWKQAWHEYRAFIGRQRAMEASYAHLAGAQRSFHVSPLSLLAGGWRRIVRRLKRTTSIEAFDPIAARAPNRLWRELYLDLTQRSIPTLLRYADRNAMAFGVEVRNPFLDYRLVEFLMAIPSDLKIRDGWTKFVLREAGRETLPEVVRTRVDKVGFQTPEDHWLRGPLRNWAENVLFHSRLLDLPGYPLRRITADWQMHQDERSSRRSALWPWLSLHTWLSLVEDGGFTQAQPVRLAA